MSLPTSIAVSILTLEGNTREFVFCSSMSWRGFGGRQCRSQKRLIYTDIPALALLNFYYRRLTRLSQKDRHTLASNFFFFFFFLLRKVKKII
jgi:hypothetical protein